MYFLPIPILKQGGFFSVGSLLQGNSVPGYLGAAAQFLEAHTIVDWFYSLENGNLLHCISTISVEQGRKFVPL